MIISTPNKNGCVGVKKPLFNTGCIKVTVDIEMGNERIAEMNERGRFQKAVPHVISLIESYRPRMLLPPTYQFIIDNPYETLDETLETLQLAASLPRPWHELRHE